MGELSVRKTIGLGAGGHAKVLISIINELDTVELVGLLDHDQDRWGKPFLGYRILGGDDQLPRPGDKGVTHAFVGFGSVGNNYPRGQAFERITQAGLTPITLLHPRAIIARPVQIGAGTCVMAGAVIQPDVRLAENVVVNTSASIDHDCDLAAHVFVAPGAVLSGGVTVGAYAHIGTGAIIRQGISIGENAVIGAGAVVVKNVPDNMVMVGNPAKILRENL